MMHLSTFTDHATFEVVNLDGPLLPISLRLTGGTYLLMTIPEALILAHRLRVACGAAEESEAKGGVDA